MLEQIFPTMESVSWGEAVLRVILAFIGGFVLGWERDSKNKPIDFRAFIIVAVITCVITMTAQELSFSVREQNELLSLDLAKIISGVLTGIGFLGAGVIMKRDDNSVVGTATGASIWAAGGFGLILGFGYYGLAILAFVVIVATLVLGGILAHKYNGLTKKK